MIIKFSIGITAFRWLLLFLFPDSLTLTFFLPKVYMPFHLGYITVQSLYICTRYTPTKKTRTAVYVWCGLWVRWILWGNYFWVFIRRVSLFIFSTYSNKCVYIYFPFEEKEKKKRLYLNDKASFYIKFLTQYLK